MPAWDIAKPLAAEAIDQDLHPPPRTSLLFYPAALALSARTLTSVDGVIRRNCKKIGPCRGKLSSGRQALLVLAYLRQGAAFAELAAGFGVGSASLALRL